MNFGNRIYCSPWYPDYRIALDSSRPDLELYYPWDLSIALSKNTDWAQSIVAEGPLISLLPLLLSHPKWGALHQPEY